VKEAVASEWRKNERSKDDQSGSEECALAGEAGGTYRGPYLEIQREPDYRQKSGGRGWQDI
jgi:hypothetical protein